MYRHSESVVVQPFFGSCNHLKEILILLILNEFRSAQTLAHPFLTVDRVGINRVVEFVFLLPCEAVYNGKKLPNVIGSAFKHWAFEQFRTSVDKHPSIFHLARIS